ncbi:hypothetical protein F2Q68_00029345 [Brassica cretica]|uniref:KIB1-4 beta-propeller domain-containing protein n=1 Tax=Brassica cretica TaxID=69181 RepID=A0A8S9GCZ2_BRACR|nr:hypothetical protein F2Q68_00029345 [Brassica cretica]
MHDRMVYTRKGDGRWRRTTSLFPAARVAQQIIHNSKDHKVYIAPDISLRVFVWDFSDDIPRQNGYILPFYVGRDALVDGGTIDWGRGYYFRRMIATSVSGQVLLVACMEQDSIWEFRIYAYDPLTKTGERVNDLGDEALIFDMGFTVVVAKDIPGIKRNSIYFSYFNIDHQSKDPEHIFVYDLHTRTTERLPQWVVSSNQTNSNNSCVLFVPDDKDNLYKTRDLGAEFTRSCCLASYGSWFLMFDQSWNLYIVNPLTLEIMDLPHSSLSKEDITRQPRLACLWVDKR